VLRGREASKVLRASQVLQGRRELLAEESVGRRVRKANKASDACRVCAAPKVSQVLAALRALQVLQDRKGPQGLPAPSVRA